MGFGKIPVLVHGYIPNNDEDFKVGLKDHITVSPSGLELVVSAGEPKTFIFDGYKFGEYYKKHRLTTSLFQPGKFTAKDGSYRCVPTFAGHRTHNLMPVTCQFNDCGKGGSIRRGEDWLKECPYLQNQNDLPDLLRHNR